MGVAVLELGSAMQAHMRCMAQVPELGACEAGPASQKHPPRHLSLIEAGAHLIAAAVHRS